MLRAGVRSWGQGMTAEDLRFVSDLPGIDLPGMRKRNTAQRWRTAMISPRWYNENNRTSNAGAAQAERIARDRERIHRP